MSKFRTNISDLSSTLKFEHQLPVLLLGSCFAEHIGAQLSQYKFSRLLNPFGILYNPFSIGNALEFLIQKKTFEEKDLIQANGLWHSFDHHGHFSKSSAIETLHTINASAHEASQFLKKSKRLVLTFGTSNVFVYKNTQQIVANCHKIPNQDFDRKALSVDAILQKLSPVLEQLKTKTSDLEILLTVSPVRHSRDGLIENQRSKARLLIACEQLCKQHDFVHYFPSYEIMMDDLRDYRFYTQDMLHPNQTAIDYIWDFFGKTYFTDSTKELNLKIGHIIKASEHRAFHPNSEAHQHFIKKQLSLINDIQKEVDLDFAKEMEIFQKQLIE